MQTPVSKTNDVTLFSNGIGHFRRVYVAPKGDDNVAISIPFKKDNIGDVAASLQVFGKVRLTSPPSFTPENSNATSLNISQREAMKSLLTQLSGSTITLATGAESGEYQLLGMDVSTTIHGDCEIQNDYVVVMKGASVYRYRLADVGHIDFKDDAVQTEIEKALKSNFQKIKPDSTLLDLTLKAVEGAEDFSVQYTIPVAAWKMRYAIREEKGNFTLEGAAIIDNNTDEDWDNFRVSVVTGNPISFSTDIANVVVPKRRFINLVDDTVLGNVNVEESSPMRSVRSRGAVQLASAMGGLESMGPKGSVSNYASFGLESCDAESLGYAGAAAEHAGVDSKDVGDFCIFTSREPVTILARKSAVVPMFSVPIKHAGVVLLYKQENHATRPYRAVKLKNETEWSLGKGKTIIYNEGIFSGECVLEATKPGDNRMLPHCLENGVSVSLERLPHSRKLTAIRISKGVGILEEVVTATTQYSFKNKKGENFKIAMEHQSVLGGTGVKVDFEGIELQEQERLSQSNGWRAYFSLAEKEMVTLSVTETRVDRTEVSIGGNYNWIYSNIVAPTSPLASNEYIQKCIQLQQKIDDIEVDINKSESRVNELNEERQGVRDDLKAAEGIASGDKLTGWVTEIDNAKEEIREIQKVKIPSLTKQRDELRREMREHVSGLSVSWSNQ